MSGFFCNFVSAKNKKHHFRRGTAVTEHIRLMTKNQSFFIEQISLYLNLLAERPIFKVESKARFSLEDELEVTITCKNYAYCNEMNLLTILIDRMTAICDNRETSVKIR